MHDYKAETRDGGTQGSILRGALHLNLNKRKCLLHLQYTDAPIAFWEMYFLPQQEVAYEAHAAELNMKIRYTLVHRSYHKMDYSKRLHWTEG